MSSHRRLSYLSSIAAAVVYALLALLAFFQYPTAFSPLSNWLSDLGDPNANPQGAIFYNIGIISTGVLLVPFFWGLSRWKMPPLKIQRAMLITTQTFGFLGCLALIMSAVYPINHPEQHEFWSISLYILLGTAFAFSVSALRYHPRCPRWVLLVGALTALVDIVSGIWGNVYVLEWITVALFLGYALILGSKTRGAQAVATTIPPLPAESSASK